MLVEQICYCLLPLAVQYVAAFLVGTCLPGADASLQVFLSGALCLPVLAYWRIRDQRKMMHWQGGGQSNRQERLLPCYVKARTKPLQCILLCAICLLAGACLSRLSALLMEQTGMYSRFSNETQEAFASSSPVWLILGPGIMAPLAEELTYRGLLYPRLQGMCYALEGSVKRGRSEEHGSRKSYRLAAIIAALLSSLLFALGHGNMIQFLYAFPMGLLLCALCDRWGMGLLPPFMLHLGANLYSVAAAVIIRSV